MKVSIITVVYNNKDHISDCIESVINQTYPNIEHIIIDGGSSDGTQRAIEPYQNMLSYYISEKDKGMYHALNKGIKKATGRIIGVLHSDDVFYELNTIEKIVETFNETKIQLLYANGKYISNDVVANVKRIYRSSTFKKYRLYFGWVPLHTTLYVRKEIFEDFGYYDETFEIAGDYDISLRWFFNDDIKKHFLPEWVVKMRLGGKSTSYKSQIKKSREDLRVIKKYNLMGYVTLFGKIGRKIPQYVIPNFISFD